MLSRNGCRLWVSKLNIEFKLSLNRWGQGCGACRARCGDLRGEQQGAVHEGAVVVVVDEVVGVAGLVANLWLGDDLHGDVVLGVVEVDDVHVKDQHGRAGDVLA